ncbi:hypothetical protein [Aliarcobacter butzleri]|uniref:hypothetical protein n=1 Tax=Aliarcobacter butzleri TaxID=28197 RepID=UPI001EDDDAE5|nr:hypothetical protein [Aliarcobacter butzleri]MCG3694653.1 hypothetical protein [Aliarcobacter butzleri]MDK2090525.1 hypothetical protein [Aliarcobacter butzleri]
MTISLIEFITYNILSIIISSGIITMVIKTKIEQSIKHNYDKQLERLKQDYKEKFDLIKNQNDLYFSELKNNKDRYNSKQFEIYNNLWTSLVELKFSADTLWNTANQRNLKDFSTKVSSAKKSIEISSLLLENNDYENLISLIKSFNDFQFGKGLLLEKIQNKTTLDFKNSLVDDTEISNTIENNRQMKENYDALIIKLKEKFKEQIKGN